MRGRDVRADNLLYQPKKVGSSYIQVEKNIYGYLYNWYVVEDNRRIAASGWRVPNRNDYINLITLQEPLSHWNGIGWTTLNKPRMFGLREVPQAHPRWERDMSFGTNEYNLSFYPNSCRFETGVFPNENDVEYLGKMGFVWSSSLGVQNHEAVLIKYLNNYVGLFGDPVKGYSDKRIGAGIRLIRNANSGEQMLNNGSFVSDYVGNDSRTYKAVKIENLIWTAENISETEFRNGDPVEEVIDNIEWSEKDSI